MIKLSDETIYILNSFHEDREVDRWDQFEKKKDEIFKEIPLLKMYLDKRKEYEALRKAVSTTLYLLAHDIYKVDP